MTAGPHAERSGHPNVPAVTVLVTTHSGDPLLTRWALESVLHQSFTDLELLIVVDGAVSPDLDDLLEELAADQRVRILRPGKVGRGHALNIGLDAARAPLIAIQDSDDESHPERIGLQVVAFADDPGLALLATDYVQTFDRHAHADWDLPERPALLEPVGRELLTRNVLIHTSVMARAGLFDALDGYAAERWRYFDYDLYLRANDLGARLARLDLPLVLLRSHPAQAFATEKGTRRRMEDLFRLQRAHLRGLPAPQRWWYTAEACIRVPARFARGSLRRRRMLGRQATSASGS